MLDILRHLFGELEDAGVDFCHWKSNIILDEALSGETDVDLLVGPQRSAFDSVMESLGFKTAAYPAWRSDPSVRHFFGLDSTSGMIVHAHVYYQLITGGALVKSFHLPLEQLMLDDRRLLSGVPVPSKGAELLLFVMRKLIEHGSPLEVLMVTREYPQITKEIDWLLDDESKADASELLNRWLSEVDAEIFLSGIEAVRDKSAMLKRVYLGWRLRKALRGYKLNSFFKAFPLSVRRFGWLVGRRLRGRKSRIALNKGAVIAVTGPDGSGKSTIVNEIGSWLEEYLAVERVHAGKPPPTLWTFVPGTILPVLRRILPRFRTSEVVSDRGRNPGSISGWRATIHAFRSLMLAHERERLLRKVSQRTKNGRIALSDRYPTAQVGLADSPQLDIESLDNKPSIYRKMALHEHRLYRKIPPPNLVIQLKVPVDVAIQRHRDRQDSEPEEYIVRRHSEIVEYDSNETRVIELDTTRSLEESVRDAKQEIWAVL